MSAGTHSGLLTRASSVKSEARDRQELSASSVLVRDDGAPPNAPVSNHLAFVSGMHTGAPVAPKTDLLSCPSQEDGLTKMPPSATSRGLWGRWRQPGSWLHAGLGPSIYRRGDFSSRVSQTEFPRPSAYDRARARESTWRANRGFSGPVQVQSAADLAA